MLTLPNILTLARLFLVPCFLYASLRQMWAVAFVIFVTAAVTDILDGAIARRFDLRSRIGAILDPAADKTLMICGFLFYTLSDRVPLRIPGWLTFTVFIRDFLIVMFAYLLYTRVQVKRFPPTVAGKLSTVTQAVTLAATIFANGFAPRYFWLVERMYQVALIIILYSAWDYLRHGKRLLLDNVPQPK
jgi:cardiolipin synthase